MAGIEPKRILILTADVGFGHRSAANALADALREKYGDRSLVEIANPLDDPRTPSILHDAQEDYDRLVRESPERYHFRYKLSDSTVPNVIYESAVTVMLYSIVRDIVLKFKPDVVVTTHPMYPAPVSSVLAANKLNTPFVIVVTDLVDVHISWFHKYADLWLVPTRLAYEQALDNDCSPNKVHVTGIPVKMDIYKEKRSPQEIRQEKGWDPDKTTVLVVGSKRVNNLKNILHILNHSGFPMQLVIVTGGDKSLLKQLHKEEWHLPAFIYDYVEDMPAFMHAADCIFSKAGGLIVTEALAAGLPLLFVDVTPAQEEGNAQYVVKNGAGERVENPLAALETLSHWLMDDCKVLKEYRSRAAAIGKPQSAYTAADLVWSAVDTDTLNEAVNRTAVLPWLVDLLSSAGLKPEG